MLILLFAILVFSRVYTAMATVVSAAREAADYATSMGGERWSTSNLATTVSEMTRRACIAASDQPDYVGIDTSTPPDGIDEDCSNPDFSFCITQTVGGTCDFPVDTTDPGYTCDDPSRNPPCRVTVTMHHVFHLFLPFQIEFFGVKLGLPVSVSFDRDSTFAMTDIGVSPSPSP
jgi:hypothetical protein